MSRTKTSAGFLAGVLGLVACSDSAGAPPLDLAGAAADFAVATAPDGGDVARPTCDQMLGGPALPRGSTEGQPGFDELLASLDACAVIR